MLIMFFSELTGRCRSGAENGGTRIHAIDAFDTYPSFAKAICGAKPGRLSNGWSGYRAEQPTCPRCIKKLEKAQP